MLPLLIWVCCLPRPAEQQAEEEEEQGEERGQPQPGGGGRSRGRTSGQRTFKIGSGRIWFFLPDAGYPAGLSSISCRIPGFFLAGYRISDQISSQTLIQPTIQSQILQYCLFKTTEKLNFPYGSYDNIDISVEFLHLFPNIFQDQICEKRPSPEFGPNSCKYIWNLCKTQEFRFP